MGDKTTSKRRYYLLNLLKGVAVILPLLILVTIRHERYVYSKSSAWGLTLGGILAVFVIMLCSFNALHLKGMGWSIILLLLSWFLENLLVDIQWILLCFMIGQVLSKMIGFFACEEKERVLIERGAAASSRRNEETYKKYHGNGRV